MLPAATQQAPPSALLATCHNIRTITIPTPFLSDLAPILIHNMPFWHKHLLSSFKVELYLSNSSPNNARFLIYHSGGPEVDSDLDSAQAWLQNIFSDPPQYTQINMDLPSAQLASSSPDPESTVITLLSYSPLSVIGSFQSQFDPVLFWIANTSKVQFTYLTSNKNCRLLITGTPNAISIAQHYIDYCSTHISNTTHSLATLLKHPTFLEKTRPFQIKLYPEWFSYQSFRRINRVLGLRFGVLVDSIGSYIRVSPEFQHLTEAAIHSFQKFSSPHSTSPTGEHWSQNELMRSLFDFDISSSVHCPIKKRDINPADLLIPETQPTPIEILMDLPHFTDIGQLHRAYYLSANRKFEDLTSLVKPKPTTPTRPVVKAIFPAPLFALQSYLADSAPVTMISSTNASHPNWNAVMMMGGESIFAMLQQASKCTINFINTQKSDTAHYIMISGSPHNVRVVQQFVDFLFAKRTYIKRRDILDNHTIPLPVPSHFQKISPILLTKSQLHMLLDIALGTYFIPKSNGFLAYIPSHYTVTGGPGEMIPSKNDDEQVQHPYRTKSQFSDDFSPLLPIKHHIISRFANFLDWWSTHPDHSKPALFKYFFGYTGTNVITSLKYSRTLFDFPTIPRTPLETFMHIPRISKSCTFEESWGVVLRTNPVKATIPTGSMPTDKGKTHTYLTRERMIDIKALSASLLADLKLRTILTTKDYHLGDDTYLLATGDIITLRAHQTIHNTPDFSRFSSLSRWIFVLLEILTNTKLTIIVGSQLHSSQSHETSSDMSNNHNRVVSTILITGTPHNIAKVQHYITFICNKSATDSDFAPINRLLNYTHFYNHEDKLIAFEIFAGIYLTVRDDLMRAHPANSINNDLVVKYYIQLVTFCQKHPGFSTQELISALFKPSYHVNIATHSGEITYIDYSDIIGKQFEHSVARQVPPEKLYLLPHIYFEVPLYNVVPMSGETPDKDGKKNRKKSWKEKHQYFILPTRGTGSSKKMYLIADFLPNLVCPNPVFLTIQRIVGCEMSLSAFFEDDSKNNINITSQAILMVEGTKTQCHHVQHYVDFIRHRDRVIDEYRAYCVKNDAEKKLCKVGEGYCSPNQHMKVISNSIYHFLTHDCKMWLLLLEIYLSVFITFDKIENETCTGGKHWLPVIIPQQLSNISSKKTISQQVFNISQKEVDFKLSTANRFFGLIKHSLKDYSSTVPVNIISMVGYEIILTLFRFKIEDTLGNISIEIPEISRKFSLIPPTPAENIMALPHYLPRESNDKDLKHCVVSHNVNFEDTMAILQVLNQPAVHATVLPSKEINLVPNITTCSSSNELPIPLPEKDTVSSQLDGMSNFPTSSLASITPHNAMSIPIPTPAINPPLPTVRSLYIPIPSASKKLPVSIPNSTPIFNPPLPIPTPIPPVLTATNPPVTQTATTSLLPFPIPIPIPIPTPSTPVIAQQEHNIPTLLLTPTEQNTPNSTSVVSPATTLPLSTQINYLSYVSYYSSGFSHIAGNYAVLLLIQYLSRSSLSFVFPDEKNNYQWFTHLAITCDSALKCNHAQHYFDFLIHKDQELTGVPFDPYQECVIPADTLTHLPIDFYTNFILSRSDLHGIIDLYMGLFVFYKQIEGQPCITVIPQNQFNQNVKNYTTQINACFNYLLAYPEATAFELIEYLFQIDLSTMEIGRLLTSKTASFSTTNPIPVQYLTILPHLSGL